jgi:hypothetical protein
MSEMLSEYSASSLDSMGIRRDRHLIAVLFTDSQQGLEITLVVDLNFGIVFLGE